METSKRMEDYPHIEMDRIASEYGDRLRDAVNDIMQRLMDGGEREIRFADSIWCDMGGNCTPYTALQVHTRHIDVCYIDEDAQERVRDLGGMDLYMVVTIIGYLTRKLSYAAYSRDHARD